jgi:hypothetical protein
MASASVLARSFDLEVIGAAIFIAAVLVLILCEAFTRAESLTLARAQCQIHSERDWIDKTMRLCGARSTKRASTTSVCFRGLAYRRDKRQHHPQPTALAAYVR